MSKGQRIVTLCLWSLLAMTMVGVVAAKWILPRMAHAAPPAVLFPAAKFSFTDENGATVSSDQLRGKPYVASFMFTQCAGICPQMNRIIKKLQNEIPDEVQFVSFTVDPAHDDAKTLKAYAQALGADESRWHFLTGEITALQETAEAMKLTFRDWPAGHSARLILVDGNGDIRGAYLSTEPAAVEQLAKDANALVRSGEGTHP